MLNRLIDQSTWKTHIEPVKQQVGIQWIVASTARPP